MKTTLKKLALAAGTTAALAGSMSANAILQGLPGEAQLIPLAYSTGLLAVDASLNFQPVDTVVRFVTARSVGGDTLIQFTAPHVQQGNPLATQPNGVESLPSPGWGAAGTTANAIHWILLDTRSQHLDNASIPVTADDVAVFSLSSRVPGLGGGPVLGYLVAVTEAAYNGTANANFAFFADAFLTIGPVAAPVAVVTIPTLALADGADTLGGTPSVFNEVQELGLQPNVNASPIAAGIRTSGSLPWRVVDLTLNRNDLTTNGTLTVVWNDRNLFENILTPPSAFQFPFEIYGDNENHYSRAVRVPNELNIYRAQTLPQAVTSGLLGDLATPINLQPDATNVNGEGFGKLFVPRPAGSSTGLSNSAMFAFTVGVESTFPGSGTWNVVSPSWLPHDRGTFTGF